MPKSVKRWSLLTVPAVLAIAVAGCGGSSSSGPGQKQKPSDTVHMITISNNLDGLSTYDRMLCNPTTGEIIYDGYREMAISPNIVCDAQGRLFHSADGVNPVGKALTPPASELSH